MWRRVDVPLPPLGGGGFVNLLESDGEVEGGAEAQLLRDFLQGVRGAVEQAAGRIVVMGCGALDTDNIRTVRDATGLKELHFAALRTVQSGMTFRNPHVGMGGTEKDREYELTLTDPEAVRATIAAAKSA